MKNVNPIELHPVSQVSSVDHASIAVSVFAQRQTANEEDEPPFGYTLENDGIYAIVDEDEDEDAMPVWLCSPLEVIGRGRRENGSDWGRIIELIDPDGHRRRSVVWDASLLSGPAAILGPLARLGLRVASSAKAKKAVVELLSRWNSDTRFTFIDHLGWNGEDFSSFSFGSARMIGGARVHFIGDDAASIDPMRPAGSLAGWIETVGAKAEGNPLMIVCIGLALTGPLLEIVGVGSGGLHLRGLSSRGKSTLLMTSASVYGGKAFMNTWRVTSNGLEGIASSRNSTVLVLDEISEVSPQDVGAAIYMLGNGQGKTRSRSLGGSIPAQRWNVAVLSSGEISLEQHMAQGNCRKMSGHEMRLLDVVADEREHGAFDCIHDAESARAFAEGIAAAIATNHGTLGPAYVKKLIGVMRDRSRNLAIFERYLDQFRQEAERRFDLSGDGQTQRALKRFALIALAGRLATGWGLTGWTRETSREAALEVFGVWLAQRDIPTRREVGGVVSHIENHLRAHGATRFVSLTEAAPATTVARVEGWRDEHWFYFTSDAWNALHGDRASARDAAELMQTAGHLRCNNGTGLQFKMPRGVAGRAVTYCVSAKVVGK